MKLAHADALVLRARLRLDAAQAPASTPGATDPRRLALDDAEGALQIAQQCGYVWAERDALVLLVEISRVPRRPLLAEAYARDLAPLTDRLDREIAAGRKVTDEHFATLGTKTGSTTPAKTKRWATTNGMSVAGCVKPKDRRSPLAGGPSMTQVTLEEAQSRLPELIAGLRPGEELQITKDNQPVARIVAEPPRPREPRRPGSAVGMLTIVADDEEHLEDFKDYMP
jgi:antitoxin (DNA-binding transcriptional repressor) of toxin-antitoxin stability system